MVLLRKPQFWFRDPTPLSTYVTPLLLIITPFIISPPWVPISSLDTHRVSLPFPVPPPWVRLGIMPRMLKQLKRKSKSINGHIQQENVPQDAKDGWKNIFSTWAKDNTWAMAITLVPWALHHPFLSFRNPWLSQPPVRNELPYQKGGIQIYLTHHALILWATTGHLMYHDCSRLYIIYLGVGLLSSSYPCTIICGLGLPLSLLIPFTPLSHATIIWRMYLGHIIPSKGRNHLIRYLVNPFWSLETLAHAKTYYGSACHYELSTCCRWFVSSFTWLL